jgi:hypothetical protein
MLADVTRSIEVTTRKSPGYHQPRSNVGQAVLAHSGEALEQRHAFEHLAKVEQDALIEFLKFLQVLPAGAKALIVDELYRPN